MDFALGDAIHSADFLRQLAAFEEYRRNFLIGPLIKQNYTSVYHDR